MQDAFERLLTVRAWRHVLAFIAQPKLRRLAGRFPSRGEALRLWSGRRYRPALSSALHRSWKPASLRPRDPQLQEKEWSSPERPFLWSSGLNPHLVLSSVEKSFLHARHQAASKALNFREKCLDRNRLSRKTRPTARTSAAKVIAPIRQRRLHERRANRNRRNRPY